MLGAEAAVQFHGEIVDGGAERFALGQEGGAVHGFGLIDVEMHIAVADMAEGNGPRAREHLRTERNGLRR